MWDLLSYPDVSLLANHRAWLGCSYSGDECFETADDILVLDCDVPWIPTRWKPNEEARIFHIDVNPLKQNMPLFYINALQRHRADTIDCFNSAERMH